MSWDEDEKIKVHVVEWTYFEMITIGFGVLVIGIIIGYVIGAINEYPNDNKLLTACRTGCAFSHVSSPLIEDCWERCNMSKTTLKNMRWGYG